MYIYRKEGGVYGWEIGMSNPKKNVSVDGQLAKSLLEIKVFFIYSLFIKIRHHNALMNHDVIIHIFIFILYTFFFVKFLFDKIMICLFT